MLLLALILLPVVAGAVAYVLPVAGRRMLLMATAVVHFALTLLLWIAPGATAFNGWLADDALGRLVLTLVSVLFVLIAQYALGYLRDTDPRGGRAFTSCMLGFLAATSLVSVSHHFALLWIGMESTTLTVAPLIFNRDDRRSLEAVWKYLVLSSVAIAFALLGVFFLAAAQPTGAAGGRPLVLEDMIAHAAALDPVWLRAAFVFMLIGFGTKMGLAPLHAWKPDTYGEAPSLVSGLMAGALTSCAFLGLARVFAICVAAGPGVAAFARPPLIAFGMLSLAVAAAFMIGQSDVKRMLAYSSVEHMGLLALALGLGGIGTYGAVLHALNNGLAKALLFLAVGNVALEMGTSEASRIRGLLRRVPASGALLVIGLFAVTGSPPFGMFVSEFTIISAAIREHHASLAVALVVLLAIIFVAIAAMILEVVYAPPPSVEPPAPPRARGRDRGWLVAAPAMLAVLVLALGLWIPRPLADALSAAATVLGGQAP